MPIKTKYEIFNSRHAAAHYTTFDKDLARAEFNALIRKGDDLYRMVQTPIADGALTKPEEYLLLVYKVRKQMRQYFDRGRKKEDLMVALNYEKRLDDWNSQTRSFLDSHLCDVGVRDAETTKRMSFFILVEAWRTTWKERRAYSKRKMGFDPAILKEMSKKCRDIEKEIDKYIKDQLNLI